MLTDKQFNLKEKRTELENRIQICKDSKLKINEFVRNLKWQYFCKKITYENYCKQLKSVLRERSLEQWTKYYDDSIKYYERELIKLDNKRSINAIGIVLLLLMISGIGLFYLNSNITGFAVQEIGIENLTLISENTSINENGVMLKEDILQGYAEIGKPVKLIKRIKANDSLSNITILLPEKISDMKIRKIVDNTSEKIDNDKIKINGNKEDYSITDIGNRKETEYVIEENVNEIEIEYYGEAPRVIENEINENRKEIIVYSDIHYENILAYTNIKEAQKEAIKLYRTTNGIRELTEISDYEDANNNGLTDKIKWIVPSLSNETYEVIIEISKAIHLDSNKNFISDIYNEAYQLDDIWSEEIKDNEYVRITFKQKLDSSRDITIYPRIISGNPKIEVYEFNKTEMIAEFSLINPNQYNKIYLTNLIGMQDTFDLKILYGSIQFDHIIDPSYDIWYINASIAHWASTDFPTLTDCSAGSLDIDDTTYCGNSMSIEAGESGFVNSTHLWDIPTGSTITKVEICTLFSVSGKMDDNAADTVKIYAGENSTESWIYTLQDSCISTGCTAWETEAYHCYDITSIINTPLKASSVRISVTAYQGDGDANQNIVVDHNYVNVSYTTANTAPDAITNVNINSTTLLQENKTTEDIQVRFYASDSDGGDTLNYSIQWINNSVTHTTYTNIAVNNPGVAVETLKHENTTKWDNWSAQILVCDNSNSCNSFTNTSILRIMNSNATITTPAFNDSEYNTEETINVSLIFSDDDNDNNDITFEWFKNNALIRRTINSNLANGTNTTDVLTSASFTTGDTIIVQAFAYDGELNSTLLNSTELTITSSNAAPNNPSSLIINSTTALQLNLTDEDLRMNFQCDDPDAGDTLTYHLMAYRSGVKQFQIEGSCSDPEYESVILDRVNTTKFDNWSFSVNVTDAAGAYSDTISSIINVSIRNSLPAIGNVTLDMADSVSIIESGNKTLLFSFVMTDADNTSDINNFSGVANISRGGETTRHNDTFEYANDGGCFANNKIGENSMNFSCSIQIVFYDGAGEWNISVRANDTHSFVQNITKTFTLIETTSIAIDVNTFAFPLVVPNNYNITSTTSILVNNTGNDDLTATGETLNISAITLTPASGTTFIPASNFSMGTVYSNSDECDTSLVTTTTRFTNTTDAAGYSNFTGALVGTTLPAQATGNTESLELCLIHAPSNLVSTTYSTANSGAWTIIAF